MTSREAKKDLCCQTKIVNLQVGQKSWTLAVLNKFFKKNENNGIGGIRRYFKGLSGILNTKSELDFLSHYF